MRVRICGHVWDVQEVSPSRAKRFGGKGVCNRVRRTVRVNANLPDRKSLDTVIHELLHAAEWNMSEEWVTSTADDIARVLWRLGWRRPCDS